MNVLILIKLIAAHLIGDFFLQTDSIAQGKFSKGGRRMAYLSLHSLINAAMAYLLVGLWDCWQIPAFVFVTHFLIDFTKSCIKQGGLWLFLADQTAHLAVLTLLWLWLTDGVPGISLSWLSDTRLWVVAIGYMLLMKPTSLLLGMFLAKWTPASNDRGSLPSAGTWIGYLERTLIFTFMLVGCMEGIGFLLAAKSIFRFGELTKAREVKITEYVMIGTLSSFAIAILVGAMVKQL